jgi:hypothetical protein
MWAIAHGCAAWHVLVSRLVVMIPYETTPACYLLVNLSQIYLSWFYLEMYISDLNLVSLPSKVANQIIFEETSNGRERSRLQVVVDKGLNLIYREDQAT